jgi:putative heme-binding domain-containing protein
MMRSEDAADSRIPLLVWWALERFAESHRAEIIAAFAAPERWASPLAQKHILARLAQRYASLPSTENQQTLARLAKTAPPAGLSLLRQGIAAAFEGRGLAKLTPEMENAFFSGPSSDLSDPIQLSLAIRRGDPAAVLAAMGLVVREDHKLEPDRVKVLEALGDAQVQSAQPVLLEVLSRTPSRPVQEAALGAISRLGDPQLVKKLLRLWANLDPVLRERALLLLASRRDWARELLQIVHRVELIPKTDITATVLQAARLLGDTEINAIADRYYGAQRSATTSEKQQKIDAVAKLLTSGSPGNAAAGARTYAARCASCHELFGEGGKLGPELTGKERTNVQNMLLNIIDPSASLREGYTLFHVKTRDERTLVGFIDARDANRVVLRDAGGQRTTVPPSDIVEEKALPTSLMPEGLLEGLSDRELRDFFAYLSSPAAPAGKATN